MDNAAEAGVLGLRRKSRANFVAITAEPEMESVRIMSAADEAVACVGKLDLAHFMKTLSRRPTR